MSQVTHYDEFYTIDELTARWWRRDVFFTTISSTALILLQDTGGPALDIGLVVGASDVDALAQVNVLPSKQNVGNAEVIRRFRSLITKGDLLPLIISTAKERGKDRVAIKGNLDIVFESAICDILEGVGFQGASGSLIMEL